MIGIGIDFGTTNSVVALAGADGRVEAMSWPTASWPTASWPTADALTETFRTALAFRSRSIGGKRSSAVTAGPEAIAWALEPTDNQRFVQSIKTHLGSAAFRETRIFGDRRTLEELIGLFLRLLIEKGRFGDGSQFDAEARIAAGRPVVFAGERPDEDLAVERLRGAYRIVGVADPDLVFEPLGAAYWYARDLTEAQTVLVADFGGGTSDFSVMRFERRDGRLVARALAHDGVGIAGDTFDFRIIDHVVAPRLGKNARYRSFDKWLPVPRHFFAAFSRWHQLSWLKGDRVLSDLEAITEASDEPAKLSDLRTVIDYDLGLDLYAAISAAKARLSEEDHADFVFDKAGVALSARIARRDFESWIAEDLAAISAAMERAIAAAGVEDDDIDAIFLTGGTSYVPAVKRIFERRFGAGRLHIGNAFQSVASGLALVALDKANAAAASA